MISLTIVCLGLVCIPRSRRGPQTQANVRVLSDSYRALEGVILTSNLGPLIPVVLNLFNVVRLLCLPRSNNAVAYLGTEQGSCTICDHDCRHPNRSRTPYCMWDCGGTRAQMVGHDIRAAC